MQSPSLHRLVIQVACRRGSRMELLHHGQTWGILKLYKKLMRKLVKLHIP